MNILFKSLIIVLLQAVVFFSESCYAINMEVNKELQKFVKEALPHSMFGYIVREATTGKLIVAYNENKYFIPESNAKLFTAVAALKLLGNQYKFKTTLSYKSSRLIGNILNGNLYITFTGDPSLTRSNLKNLISSISKKNIKVIKGNIIIDNYIFSGQQYPLGSSIDNIPYCYMPFSSAIVLNHNCIEVTLKPVDNKFIILKQTENFPCVIDNKVKVSDKNTLTTCVFQPTVNQFNQISLTGCLPYSKQWKIAFSIKNSMLYAKKIIYDTLKKRHIKFNGKVKRGHASQNDLEILSIHYSKPLAILIKKMLKDSDSLYALNLTRLMGYKLYHIGSIKAGSLAIFTVLKPWTSIDFKNLRLEDGAGVSRYNLVSPWQLSQLLLAVYHSNLNTVIDASLPVGGQSGTLASRMRRAPLNGKVFAKTGTMTGGSSLSGYMKINKHQTLVFSIMIENYLRKTAYVRNIQDKFLTYLYKASLQKRSNRL